MKYTIGPGPGAYALPPGVGYAGHDPSRPRAPMYSLGATGKGRPPPRGPGPAYRVDGLTNRGIAVAPQWSFGLRVNPRSTSKAPGPGAHAPERCPYGHRAPMYSLGIRPDISFKRPGPAANAYAPHLPLGSPAYSLGIRGAPRQLPRSPGPAVYYQANTGVYLNRAPEYSLGIKGMGGGRGMKSPGPAAYPSNLYNTKKNPYAYSFGTKHSDCAPPMIVREDTMDCL
ncbi:hypothetical protein ACJJTC_007358 [Scirpophaga incertulas]